MPKEAASDIHIDIPENVSYIIRTLESRGFEAYAVGGCVRDTLIGRIPGDWDITTSALPGEIKSCFRRTVDTGIEHGTVTVMLGSDAYEVTTYRIDGEYRDNRHPESVSFTASVEEDLKRRDFTINAMAYNERTGILDLFHGREDLEAGIIRCVGDADERFDEDALRILRAVRFAAQLDFDIEEKTAAAVTGHAANLQAVSRERILTEITKLICSSHIERINDIFELGLAPYISEYFDEIDIKTLHELCFGKIDCKKKNNCSDEENDGAALYFDRPDISREPDTEEASEYYNRYLTFTEKNAIDEAFDLKETTTANYRFIRCALLTEGMDTEHIRKMLKGLKPDNDTLHNTLLLSELLYKPFSADRYCLKNAMAGVSPELFFCLMRLKLISCGTTLYRARCTGEELSEVFELYEDISRGSEAVYLKELAVNGSDLIACGIKPGPHFGELLKKLLDIVHQRPELNTKEQLLQEASKLQISENN